MKNGKVTVLKVVEEEQEEEEEDEVYKARPRTLEALKRQVTEYVQQVPLATCRKVGDNFKVRVAACRRRRGGHIEHISYHKLAGF